MIISFPDSTEPATALANELDMPHSEIGLHRFPDGESKLTLPQEIAPWVFIYRSLDQPNAKLIEILLAVRELRKRTTVGRVSLVAPYLSYMRQDIAFSAGEVVSQQIVADYLAELFDDVITVDPHLHRIDNLSDLMPNCNAVNVSATGIFAEHLTANNLQPLLVGPDAESIQWVQKIASNAKLKFVVGTKLRTGDRAVKIELPRMDYAGRFVVLVDDVASTGFTLAEATRNLKALGAERVGVMVTHPLFVDDALADVYKAGVDWVGSSNSVEHETNIVSVCQPIAVAVRNLAEQAEPLG